MEINKNNEKIIELTDSKVITGIINKAFMTVALQYGFTKETVQRFPAFIGADIIEKQLIDGLKMYGYKIDEQMVGCVGYSYYKEQTYIIERLAVLPDYRHLGIGKKLMAFIENQIKEKGGKISEIHVIDMNEILVEWYKKLNYKQIRTDKLYDGTRKLPFNSCVMNKELN
ncbi:GNAT family N-acetyltransferase [Treponema sp. R80B11-R83G3]